MSTFDHPACTDYPIDYDRDRYEGYHEGEQRRYEAEQEQEEAYELAEAARATGEVDIAPGIHVVRTSGACTECGGPRDSDLFLGVCRGCATDPAPDPFDDDEYDEYDEYDALIDGKPRW